MKVLFISSGNKGNGINPIIINQGAALVKSGVEVDYYPIVGKGVVGYLKNIIPLYRYVRSNQYDVIHAHYSLTAFVANLAGCKRLVVSLMGSDVKASRRYKTIIKCFATLFRWRTIIVKSRDMYTSLGIFRAVIIPNGVDVERFKALEQSVCQKTLGWDVTHKHILFPANPKRPEKDFALAQSAIESLSKQVTETIDVHVFENVPNEETPYHYNAADVVLMTSKWEGSPNAIKEAMACCRPIVSANVGDVAERLCEVEGCYVAKTREVDEVAELLLQALAFGKRTDGQRKIEEDGLSSVLVASKLVEIYQSLLKK